jgi:hypothetical protein
MPCTSDIHRYPDGSIDFGHYRRAAARDRAAALRHTAKLLTAAIGKAVAVIAARLPQKLAAPRLQTR